MAPAIGMALHPIRSFDIMLCPLAPKLVIAYAHHITCMLCLAGKESWREMSGLVLVIKFTVLI